MKPTTIAGLGAALATFGTTLLLLGHSGIGLTASAASVPLSVGAVVRAHHIHGRP